MFDAKPERKKKSIFTPFVIVVFCTGGTKKLTFCWPPIFVLARFYFRLNLMKSVQAVPKS